MLVINFGLQQHISVFQVQCYLDLSHNSSNGRFQPLYLPGGVFFLDNYYLFPAFSENPDGLGFRFGTFDLLNLVLLHRRLRHHWGTLWLDSRSDQY